MDVNVTSAGGSLPNIPLVEIGAAGAPGLETELRDALEELHSLITTKEVPEGEYSYNIAEILENVVNDTLGENGE